MRHVSIRDFKNKKSDFQNSNTCSYSRLYDIFKMKPIFPFLKVIDKFLFTFVITRHKYLTELQDNFLILYTYFTSSPKSYIPSTINILKGCSPKPFGQKKMDWFLASSKTEIFNKIGI